MNRLEPGSRKGAAAKAGGGKLQDIVKEGNSPGDEDDHCKRDLHELQMTRPCEGHEDVGQGQKADGQGGDGQRGHDTLH